MKPAAIRVGVEAVEVSAPGMMNWASSRAILAGAVPWRDEPMVLQAPAQLSPAERRRAIPNVRLALAVGAGAVAQSGLDPATLPVVFASSGADGETINSILTTLATPDRAVSPTQFHNSVHNAPSGYWGVAMQSREAVTSLSAYNASLAAGLLEAGVQVVSGNRPVLLVAYDVPYPQPLNFARRITSSFGVAFVLTPTPSVKALGEFRIARAEHDEPTGCPDPGLEALRLGNPAARCLPLLALLATGSRGTVCLEFNRGVLEVAVSPC